jgi:hypothetical protein
MRMLAERIDDEPFLRLIKKWLKAGVLDTDGQVLRPESGTHKVALGCTLIVRQKVKTLPQPIEKSGCFRLGHC